MVLNYIHVSVIDIIFRGSQQCKMCFSVAAVAGDNKPHKSFSDCQIFTSKPAV